VAERGPGGARLAHARVAVLERVAHALGDVRDLRHQVIEERVAAALGLDHRELQRGVRVRQHRVDDRAQVIDVVPRDDAVAREVDPLARQVPQRAVRLVERL
jgi:hypothetical protein